MSRFTRCVFMSLLAFASAALAEDGTVLINQSTITNPATGTSCVISLGLLHSTPTISYPHSPSRKLAGDPRA